jgi:hypothetical protein
MKQTKIETGYSCCTAVGKSEQTLKWGELSAGIMKFADQCTPEYPLFFRGAAKR